MSTDKTCPKCTRPVTSIYHYGNKKFYNHGEGGKMPQNPGGTFTLTISDFCIEEIEMHPRGAAAGAVPVVDCGTF